MSGSGGADLSTLLTEEGYAKLPSIDSNYCMAKSMKSSSYVELADDVASHAGVHVGVTISRLLVIPHFLG